ncbi:MAG: hypothetical protein ACK4IX_13035 [Candidatus Sericytochromatia bacterium]
MVLTKICPNCKNVIESNIQRCPYCKKGARNYGEEFTLNVFVGFVVVSLILVLLIYTLYLLGIFTLISSVITYLIAISFIIIVIIGITNSLKK